MILGIHADIYFGLNEFKPEAKLEQKKNNN